MMKKTTFNHLLTWGGDGIERRRTRRKKKERARAQKKSLRKRNCKKREKEREGSPFIAIGSGTPH